MFTDFPAQGATNRPLGVFVNRKIYRHTDINYKI